MVAIRFFRIDWRKRRRCLDKVTKYAGMLAIDFRAQKRIAQTWAYQLDVLKAEEAGKTDATHKIKAEDVRRIVVLIRELDSFASAVNTFLVFFMRIKAIVDDMKKDYENARRLGKKAGVLHKQLKNKKSVLKSKHRVKKMLFRSEIRDIELEYKAIEEDFKYAKSEYELATKAYKRYKKQFKKERKGVEALVKEIRARMDGYRKLMNSIGSDRKFTKFYLALRSHKTRTNLRKFSKWLRRYRWYYS